MPAIIIRMPSKSLDGRTFKLVSSSASLVNADDPTVFHYHEKDGVIWGDYVGDTVSHGRLVGSRERDSLAVWFAHHRIADGVVLTGTSSSTIRSEGGLTSLIERFDVDGVEHESVCVEVP
jgi:hypothetical protein